MNSAAGIPALAPTLEPDLNDSVIQDVVGNALNTVKVRHPFFMPLVVSKMREGLMQVLDKEESQNAFVL